MMNSVPDSEFLYPLRKVLKLLCSQRDPKVAEEDHETTRNGYGRDRPGKASSRWEEDGG